MKTITIILIVAIMSLEIHCAAPKSKPKSIRLGDTFNLYTVKEKMIDAFANVRSKAGNVLTTMKRVFNYTGKRFESWFANRDFILEQKDAAYFFQDEQEARDQAIALMEEELELKRQKRDEARKSVWPWKWSWNIPGLLRDLWRGIQFIRLNRKIGKMKGEVASAREFYNPEYLCEDPNALENTCRLALNNEKLQKRISMRVIVSETMIPECKMKSVYLPETEFKSVRQFLKCPVVAFNRRPYDGPEIETYAYISSVENPSKYRMRFYLFMSPELKFTIEPLEPIPIAPPGALHPSYPPYPAPYYHSPPYDPKNFSPHESQNPPYLGYPANYSPPRDQKYSPQHDTQSPPPYWSYAAYYSPPHEIKDASQLASQNIPNSLPPATDSPVPSVAEKSQRAPHPPPPQVVYYAPQNSAHTLYPTIDSPPRETEKPPRPPNSPPHDVRRASSPLLFEGTRSRSTSPSPKNEQSKSKKGLWSFLSGGEKSEEKLEKTPKEDPELPLKIVTLVINRDFRSLERKKQV